MFHGKALVFLSSSKQYEAILVKTFHTNWIFLTKKLQKKNLKQKGVLETKTYYILIIYNFQWRFGLQFRAAFHQNSPTVDLQSKKWEMLF